MKVHLCSPTFQRRKRKRWKEILERTLLRTHTFKGNCDEKRGAAYLTAKKHTVRFLHSLEDNEKTTTLEVELI